MRNEVVVDFRGSRCRRSKVSAVLVAGAAASKSAADRACKTRKKMK